MKKTTLILSAAAMAAAVLLSSCQDASKGNENAGGDGTTTEVKSKAGDIVWFDLDRVIEEYDMANDLRSVVETKAQSIQEEINRRGNKLQNDANKFQSDLNKGLLVRSVAEQRSQKLAQQENEFNTYANQKQQEIFEEQQVMTNQIADAIKTFLDKYNEEHKYAMIIATQGSVLPTPVCVGDPDLDITDSILAGLNDEYIKTKNDKSTSTNAE